MLMPGATPLTAGRAMLLGIVPDPRYVVVVTWPLASVAVTGRPYTGLYAKRWVNTGSPLPGRGNRETVVTLCVHPMYMPITVVLAIVATLLSIVAPCYVHQTDRAKEATLKANPSVLRRALDEYYSDTGHYPEKLSALTEGHYLRALPMDPVTNRADSWVPVPGTDEDDKAIVDVRSGARGNALDGTKYSSW
jgi:general secretion pathway protein G